MRIVCAFAAALLFGALASPIAMADDSDVAGHFDIHLRGVLVAPEASIRGSVSGTPLVVTSSSITNSFVPEIDATYYVTNHIGVELIAATTQHSPHATITTPSLGQLDLGSVWLLPPTATVKYSFDPNGAFRPYVGAGVNYTLFYSPRSGALPGMKYGNSWGTALQAGVDVPINDSYFLNLDIKQIFLGDSVKALGGAVRAHATINPLLVGFGIGMRF